MRITLALAGLWALVGAVVFVRRWRARPIPERTASRLLSSAEPSSPVGQYTAVAFSKKWALLPLLGIVPTVGGVVIFMWLAASDPAHTAWETAFLVTFGPVALYLTWWGTVFLRRLVSDRPALYVDDLGIFDASESPAYRRVRWEEIERLRWVPGRPLYLAVDLSHPEDYFARQSGWRRLAESWKWKVYRNPMKINVTALAATPGELEALLRDRVLLA